MAIKRRQNNEARGLSRHAGADVGVTRLFAVTRHETDAKGACEKASAGA